VLEWSGDDDLRFADDVDPTSDPDRTLRRCLLGRNPTPDGPEADVGTAKRTLEKWNLDAAISRYGRRRANQELAEE